MNRHRCRFARCLSVILIVTGLSVWSTNGVAEATHVCQPGETNTVGQVTIAIPPVVDDGTTADSVLSEVVCADAGQGAPVLTGGSRIRVFTALPPSATAALVNIAMVDAVAPGYITADRCLDLPAGPQTESNGNHGPLTAISNLSVVPLGRVSSFCIFNQVAVDVVADVEGYFAPPSVGGQVYAPAEPTRLRDTRESGGTRPASTIMRVTIPGAAGASAALVNLTMVNGTTPGYITADLCSTLTVGPQTKSNGNYPSLTAIANLSVVPLDVDGAFCIYNSTPVDLVVDLQGTFRASTPSGLLFSNAEPARLLDTRDTGGLRLAGTVTRVNTGAAGASSALVNLTMVDGAAPGFITADRCSTLIAGPQSKSNGNYAIGDAFANLSVVSLDVDGAFCIFNSAPVDLVVDLQGTFSPSGSQAFFPTPTVRRMDSRIGTWATPPN